MSFHKAQVVQITSITTKVISPINQDHSLQHTKLLHYNPPKGQTVKYITLVNMRLNRILYHQGWITLNTIQILTH